MSLQSFGYITAPVAVVNQDIAAIRNFNNPVNSAISRRNPDLDSVYSRRNTGNISLIILPGQFQTVAMEIPIDQNSLASVVRTSQSYQCRSRGAGRNSFVRHAYHPFNKQMLSSACQIMVSKTGRFRLTASPT